MDDLYLTVPGAGVSPLDEGLVPQRRISLPQLASRVGLSPEVQRLRSLIERSALAPFFSMRNEQEQAIRDAQAEKPFLHILSEPTKQEIDLGFAVTQAARDLDGGHQMKAPYRQKFYPYKEKIDIHANQILRALDALPEPQRATVKDRCFREDQGTEIDQVKKALENFCDVVVAQIKQQVAER